MVVVDRGKGALIRYVDLGSRRQDTDTGTDGCLDQMGILIPDRMGTCCSCRRRQPV